MDWEESKVYPYFPDVGVLYVRFVIKRSIFFDVQRTLHFQSPLTSYNLTQTLQKKSCDLQAANCWCQMSVKGQDFIDRDPTSPLRLQTSWGRQYRCPAHEKHLHQTVSVPHSPTHPLPLTSHLRLLGLSGTQSGLTKHRLLILSAVRANAAVSQ